MYTYMLSLNDVPVRFTSNMHEAPGSHWLIKTLKDLTLNHFVVFQCEWNLLPNCAVANSFYLNVIYLFFITSLLLLIHSVCLSQANYIFSFAICNNRKTAYLEVLAQLLEDHMVPTSVSRK